MAPGDDQQDLLVDTKTAPMDWESWIMHAGIQHQRVEEQSMVDRWKLHRCTNIPAVEEQSMVDRWKLHRCTNIPVTLPLWMKRGDMRLGTED